MAKIIVVTGTPGAGKTTVLNGAMKKLRGVSLVNYGDVMFEISKERGIKSRDDMRKQALEVQRDIQTRAAEKIVSMSKGVTIVATHSTIRTPHGYIPGMPEWVIKSLKPSIIVLVEASPKQIAKRRAKDKTRARDSEAVAEIELQQNINRMFASAYAAMTGASVEIIINADNKLNQAVSELIKLVESLKK